MSSKLVLFGLNNPIVPPPWETKDDRVRGGASQSHLTAIEGTNHARFYGHLDTSTLGGAGFASQFSPHDAPTQHQIATEAKDALRKKADNSWNLASYDGIQLVVGEESDNKEYTFILRDQAEKEKRDDGRDKAGISWEVKFNAKTGGDCFRKQATGRKLFIPWHHFKATYRGKEVEHPEKLKTGQIRRVGIMMRSYFGKQDGDFSLVVHSISATKSPGPQASRLWFPPCIAKLWAVLQRKES